ncbi:tryptophan halogenase family protein [Gilvimarinus japonicus]|uniref:Tryptophan halogenase family protein n=1 Tax=Gilvimarinus japonicus TaxID=1796469 RepID=A0ABV7HT13_9GAMM
MQFECNNKINRLVICGGGTSGWMAAAMFARMLGQQLEITLIESSQIATVGVGEATIPPIQLFNKVLGIDESEFLRETGATIKLGIEFAGWGRPNDCYMHAFGELGMERGMASFSHYWQRAYSEGRAGDFWDYSLNQRAAKAGKFAPLAQIPETPLAGLTYAYHFDASRYAALLKRYSKNAGVRHLDTSIERVQCNDNTGDIQALQLSDGATLAGDFFIDCTGGRSLLLGQALGVDFEDYGHWLPCDRAIALASQPMTSIAPYTRSVAHRTGWCWQIPLQHRTGNGVVYDSRRMSDDEALALLKQQLPTEAAGEPNTIRFKTGRRARQWHKNCVALGLASGFLEPLESTSLHLVQSSVIRLVKCFPSTGVDDAVVDNYNRLARDEFELIRNFIILHYHLNQRDEPLWQACRDMNVPDDLARRIELFRHSGLVFREQNELFTEPAWQQVMRGQGLVPAEYHRLSDAMPGDQLGEFMSNLDKIFANTVNKLPSHDQFLRHIAEGGSFRVKTG